MAATQDEVHAVGMMIVKAFIGANFNGVDTAQVIAMVLATYFANADADEAYVDDYMKRLPLMVKEVLRHKTYLYPH